jgi:hypothetical protein
MTRIFSLAVAVLWLPPQVLGTELIAIVTDDQVALAADSRVVEMGSGRRSTGCKLHQTESLFWAAAGIVDDQEQNYRLADFINTYIANMDARAALDALERDLMGPLQRELRALRRNHPAIYVAVMKGGFILTLFAVKVRGSGVEAFSKDFRVVNDTIEAEPATTCASGAERRRCVLATGSDAIRKYSTEHPEIWNADVVHTIDALMDSASEADPEYIGPPYSILAVAPQRTEWLRQNNCPDLQQ